MKPTCIIDGCPNFQHGRGWCSKHYTRFLRHGSPTARMPGEVVNGKRVCPFCEVDVDLSGYSPGNNVCKKCKAARKKAKAIPLVIRASMVFCVECGTKFSPPKKINIVCSDACAKERNARHMREDTLRYRAIKAAAFLEPVDPRAIFERDGWICQLCDQPIDRAAKFPARLSPSVDHIVPLAAGGLHAYENCQTAHLSCNASKGARVA